MTTSARMRRSGSGSAHLLPEPVRFLVSGPIIAVLLGGAWLVTFLSGGSRTAGPQAFYLPVILASIRAGWQGGVLAGTVAGFAVGPLMPLDVATGLAQSPGNWVGRLVAFLTVGALVGWLSTQSRTTIHQALRDGRLAADLRAAIATGQLDVHYQPIVDLECGRVVGLEALTRWTRPGQGPVPPSIFIPAAERLGVVEALDEYVLMQATRLAAGWPTHPEVTEPPYVSVNVSAHTFAGADFPERVAAALAAVELPARRLHLELTETAVLADPLAAQASAHRVRALGARVSIDDFGTGQSSLSYLQRFPVDTVKIDRSFVMRLPADRRCAALTEAVVRLAGAIGAQTIAEGVETDAQLRELRALGCTRAQGYLFARAVPAGDVPAIIAAAALVPNGLAAQ